MGAGAWSWFCLGYVFIIIKSLHAMFHTASFSMSLAQSYKYTYPGGGYTGVSSGQTWKKYLFLQNRFGENCWLWGKKLSKISPYDASDPVFF